MVNFVLDLDETLIHTSEITTNYSAQLAKKSDFYFTIDRQYYWVIKRPGLDLFLDFVFKYFNVGIWTAGDKEYAKQISRRILKLPQLQRIKFIYSRQFCHLDTNSKPPMFTKPLAKVFELFPTFQAQNTIMVDNTFNVMKFNPQNGILIPDFTGNPNDCYLYHLRNLLVKYYQKMPMATPVWGLVNNINKHMAVL